MFPDDWSRYVCKQTLGDQKILRVSITTTRIDLTLQKISYLGLVTSVSRTKKLLHFAYR